MSTRSRSPALQAAGMAILPLALVAGCATQQEVSEQTGPIHQQLAAMEHAIQSAATTANAARDLAQTNHALAAAQARQLESLQAELKALQGRQAALAGQLSQSEQRLGDLAGQTTGLREKTEAIATQVAGIGERMTQTELRLDELSTQVREALAASSQDYIRLHGKVASTAVLTEDKTLYPINSPELGSGDRAKLDELVARLKAKEEDDYHLDIQGHTDNLGTDDYNYLLGKARAEVVKRYLHERGGIPLSRMSVISYGATRPAGAAGLANRRIVVNVLVLEK
jgi:outer membrane protein OmpA-like peptidoglycan-associated protein